MSSYQFISLAGLFVMVFIAWVLSSQKSAIKWKPVFTGIILQLVFGLVILKTTIGNSFFNGVKDFFNTLLSFSNQGATFIFGGLADPSTHSFGYIFAFMVLPTIIFVSALMSVLYHLGVMQKLVKFFAFIMMKIMNTSGAESLAAAANIFVGQTEAPLVIKPYVSTMTRSELMALMTGGMATVAGGVLAAFVGMGIDAGHLLAASVMSAPAALAMAKILVPETQESKTVGNVDIKLDQGYANIIDAAASGASDGLKLCLNVAAMLLAFIALISMLNGFLNYLGSFVGSHNLSLEVFLGLIFSPFALLMGVPWDECLQVGALLGKKTVLNEFVAYVDLQSLIQQGILTERSQVIATYALCGFSNFASIAIQLGGIGSIAPTRRHELAQLGVKSLIGGTLACFMTACIAGALYS